MCCIIKTLELKRLFCQEGNVDWERRHLLSVLGTGCEGTLTASFFGLMGHHVPSSWNLISSTSEQSFRISKNRLHTEWVIIAQLHKTTHHTISAGLKIAPCVLNLQKELTSERNERNVKSCVYFLISVSGIDTMPIARHWYQLNVCIWQFRLICGCTAVTVVLCSRKTCWGMLTEHLCIHVIL